MGLEYKCFRCGTDVEFYYDPNKSKKENIKILLVYPCRTCIENVKSAAYTSGLATEWREDMGK